MKKFILGVLTATMIFSLTISALAISGRMTIEVSPINIQVNGETFVPKDVNGAEVPVFAYQGTTYAPLRALAEAYGLTVGYDAEQNMATVNDEGQYKNSTTTNPVPSDSKDTTEREPDFLYEQVMSETDDEEYAKFKALWQVSFRGREVDKDGSHAGYDAVCIDDSINPSSRSGHLHALMLRMAYEYRGDDDFSMIVFYGQGQLYYCTAGY